MTNYKKLSIIILPLLLFVVIAAEAITLTKEMTEKVVIPFAIKGGACLWDSATNNCLGPNEDIVFGQADVYPKNNAITSSMIIIVFKDKLYRSTVTYYKYDETSCKDIEISEKICKYWGDEGDGAIEEYEERICEEWGISNYIQKVCDIVRLKQQSGALSIVTETGYEVSGDVNTYIVLYDEQGSWEIVNEDGTKSYYNNNIKSLELSSGDNIYKLQNIDKALEEEIIWFPK